MNELEGLITAEDLDGIDAALAAPIVSEETPFAKAWAGVMGSFSITLRAAWSECDALRQEAARYRFAAVSEQALAEEIAKLRRQVDALSEARALADKEAEQLRAKLATVDAELIQVSTDRFAADQANEELRAKKLALEDENAMLRAANARQRTQVAGNEFHITAERPEGLTEGLVRFLETLKARGETPCVIWQIPADALPASLRAWHERNERALDAIAGVAPSTFGEIDLMKERGDGAAARGESKS